MRLLEAGFAAGAQPSPDAAPLVLPQTRTFVAAAPALKWPGAFLQC